MSPTQRALAIDSVTEGQQIAMLDSGHLPRLIAAAGEPLPGEGETYPFGLSEGQKQ